MLGNQYFMARNYLKAVKELEPVYNTNSTNKGVIRKLIICYVQINKIDKGFNIFYLLVKEDVKFIIDADPIFDDCPCPEILKEFKKTEVSPFGEKSNLANGILWLYCDSKKSIDFLEKASKEYPTNNKIKEVIEIITNHISS